MKNIHAFVIGILFCVLIAVIVLSIWSNIEAQKKELKEFCFDVFDTQSVEMFQFEKYCVIPPIDLGNGWYTSIGFHPVTDQDIGDWKLAERLKKYLYKETLI